MTTFTQTPGELDIEVGAGDDLSILLDFDIALTGYTFVSQVVHPSGSTAITVVNTDLSSGQITLSLTDTQVTALGAGQYRWNLVGTVGSTSRRILAGNFSVIDYP